MFSRRPTPATGPYCAVRFITSIAFVAVDVVDRRDDDHHAVEERPEIAARQPPHQHLHRFLALDLAAVDVGEQEDDGPPSRAVGRPADGGIRERHERHRPPLFRRAEGLDAHERGLRRQRGREKP